MKTHSDSFDRPSSLNWHLSETEVGAWSVGATDEEPGIFPADYEENFCDVVIAPGDYVENHPEVRRYGLTDQVIRQAIEDWRYGKDLVELEKKLIEFLEKDVYKISEFDKRKIASLDRLGNIFYELISIIYKTIQQSSEHKYDVEANWPGLRALIENPELLEEQKNILLEIIGALQEDTQKLAEIFKSGLNAEILKQAGIKEPPNKDKIDFVNLPGAVGLVFKDGEYSRVYPNKTSSGFYIRAMNHQRGLLGHLLIINGARDPEKTVMHEYVHFLNAKYIESLGKNFDLSGGYEGAEAQQIFVQMRDELSAYSMSDEYMIEEKKLLRGGQMTFQERLAYIKESGEQVKINQEWQDLKTEIFECQRLRIEPKKLFGIFFTSSDFVIMRKRLFLFREATIA